MRIKFLTVSFLILTSITLLASYQGKIVLAISPEEQKLQEIQEKIAETQKKLAETKGQEKTLKSQLALIDTRTKLTELKIEQTEAQIVKLEKEITDLSTRIVKLSTTVDSITEVLLTRIVQTYKYGNYSTIDLIFSSHGFSDLLERMKYLQVAQANDKKVLYQLQATKATYNDQRVDRESRQTQQEKLKKDLENYQIQLTAQKKAKQELLEKTKNDEARYQGLIAQLRAEQDSIARAISNIGTVVGPVEKGQVVGAMGSTGCSTGPHLHFEVFENAKVEGGKILGNRVNPKPYLESSRLGPPLRGYPDETQITTEYGEVYFLGTHTGLDIAPKSYEGVGRAILAAEKGIAYRTSAPCRLSIAGGSSVGNGIIVDHQNGLVTLYWHAL